MPDFRFFYNEQDEFELVEFILNELKLSIVPNIIYEDSKYIVWKDLKGYSSLNTFKKYGGSYFLLGEKFTVYPLKMLRLTGMKLHGKYMILPKGGGPSIGIHFSVVQEENNERTVLPGLVSHYPTYWDEKLAQNIKVPNELKETYKTIIRFIKHNASPCERVFHYSIWAGRHAMDEYNNNKLLFKAGDRYCVPVVTAKRKVPKNS